MSVKEAKKKCFMSLKRLKKRVFMSLKRLSKVFSEKEKKKIFVHIM